jgi:hypothetical protein
MKLLITNVVYENHKEFLRSIDFDREFDPYKLKTWYHEFKLEEHNPDIPIFEIEEKPTIKITTIQDFINDKEFNSTFIKKAIETMTNNEGSDDRSESDCTTASSNNSQNLSKFMSKDLINKVWAFS